MGRSCSEVLHFFCFSFEVRVDEGDVVVTADYVAEGR